MRYKEAARIIGVASCVDGVAVCDAPLPCCVTGVEACDRVYMFLIGL